MGRHSRDDGDDEGLDEPTDDVGYRDLGFARLDTDRTARTGDPEVIYGEGKTTEQVLLLVLELLLAGSGRPAIVTRATGEMLDALTEEYDEVEIDELARCAAVGRLPEPLGRVAVLSAGTSDRFVAAEAAFIARASGSDVEQISDVGVAGIHRLLAVRQTLEQMDCLVVVAGMDGALPSAVGGLSGVPLIAVPTSVGYGASFGGLAALLTMLNSCAPGVLVCNIDNGFGAGLAAARIARRAAKPEPSKRKRRRRGRRRGVQSAATDPAVVTDRTSPAGGPSRSPVPSPRLPDPAAAPAMHLPVTRNTPNASMHVPAAAAPLPAPEPWHAQVSPPRVRDPLVDSSVQRYELSANGLAVDDTQYGLPW